MLMAYIAVRRARYFLHWALFTAFYGLSTLVPFFENIIGRGLADVLMTLFLISAIGSFLVGCRLYRSREFEKRYVVIMAVYSGSFLLLTILVSRLTVWERGFSALISFYMAIGFALAITFFEPDNNQKQTLMEGIVRILIRITVFGWIARGIMSGMSFVWQSLDPEFYMLPEYIVGTIILVILVALIILSQERMWNHMMDSEAAMDRAAILSTSSLIYSSLAREISTPVSNATLALSHVQHESDPDRQKELVQGALKNVEKISGDISRYSRLMSNEASSDSEFIRIDELLETLIEISRKSEVLGDIRFSLAAEGTCRTNCDCIVKTRPDILFHAILSLLEIAVRRNWINGKDQEIGLSFSSLSKGEDTLIRIRITGIAIPPAIMSSELEYPDYQEDRDMSRATATLLSLQELLDATTEIDSAASDLTIIVPSR